MWKRAIVILSILFCILFLIPVFAFAEGTWTKYTSGNYINDIAIDDDYIWCATQDCLVRWNRDDMTYVKFTSDDVFVETSYTGIAVDKEGIVWVGGNSLGDDFFQHEFIKSYDGTTWTTYPIGETLGGQNEFSIKVDQNNVKWFGTWCNGVFSYDGTTWVNYIPANSGLNENNVKTVAVDNDNVKWFGTWTKGISSYDGTNWVSYTEENSGILENNTKSIVVDRDNFIYEGNGPVRFDGSKWDVYEVNNLNYSIIKMCIDNENTIWAATDGGVYHFDGLSSTYYTTENGLMDNYVSALACDDNNVMWFGYRHTGLASFDGTEWKSYTLNDGPLGGGIESIAVDKSNILWVGTHSENSGVSQFDGTEWIHYLKNGEIFKGASKIAIDNNNVKWFVSTAGISSFDGTTWNEPDRREIADMRVYAIAIDHDNVKWFADLNGLASYNDTTLTRYSDEDIGIRGVKTIAVDNNNVKWFGGRLGKCVTSYDGSTWTNYTESDGLPSEYTINDIAIDSENAKWFGTSPEISSFDGNTLSTYPVGNNKIICGVTEMEFDHNGLMWISAFGGGDGRSIRGIHTFDGNTWNEITAFKMKVITALAVDQNNVKWISTYGGLWSYDDGLPVSVTQEDDRAPLHFSLHANYPNPFNPATTIEFTLPESGFARLVIYNIMGQKVRALASEQMTSGVHSMVWDGTDDDGSEVSSGLYVTRLISGGFADNRKMLLMR